MSIVKVRLKEVASDLGLSTKEVAEVLGKFFENPSPIPRSSPMRS